jgi:hypothetical protein
MARSIDARLAALEKRLGVRERRGYSLEQMIYLSHGFDAGEPQQVLKDGERSLEDLLLDHALRN